MADFLFEIGLEEIPARMIAGAEIELRNRTLALLERERLVDPGGAATSFSTPRRLAVSIPGVRDRQADLTEEVTGPAVKIAFKDGVPGPAAIAFAKKNGVAVEALRIVATPKGEYIVATSIKPGRSAAGVLLAELPKELSGIYWAKNMYWRAGKPERFVRPVRWLVALLGEEVVPVSFAGYTASNLTFGHRVLHGPEPIRISSPSAYAQTLEAAFVMADVELRRHTIRKALDRVCRTLPGTRWREDHALVDKMTHLTEWPSVIAGSFEPEYLALPEEVLVTVMRDHQSYFAVETTSPNASNELSSFAEGGGPASSLHSKKPLAPHFLAVLNTVADAAGEAIIRHGNERVLRARFNDARFFWDFDQRVSLLDRVLLLENVTFQKDLGSYAAKSERVRELAASLAEFGVGDRAIVDRAALDQAARLAKTDLTTELVKEFTELQGIVGGLYALSQGVAPTASYAIYDQYKPAGMDDSVPRSIEGALLGIADRADTIAGMFALGIEPTGSKDPFALRRAANGIVKILAETGIPLWIEPIIRLSARDESVAERLRAFFRERVEFYLREARGVSYDVIAAVLNAPHTTGFNDLRDAIARAEAVTQMRGSPDFLAVCAAFKRIRNILAQAGFSLPEDTGVVFGLGGLIPEDDPQVELNRKAEEVGNKVLALRKDRQYRQALEAMATIRADIDAFFDKVMVMDPDPKIRELRLFMLAMIIKSFSGIADFSEIVTAS